MTEHMPIYFQPAARTVSKSRSLDAPQDVVFDAWTNPEFLAQWWGPHGFTNPVCELDARPGGEIRINMRGPDGMFYPMTGVYREIVNGEKIVYTSFALDERGNPLFEVLNEITFSGSGDRTLLRMQASISRETSEAAPFLAGMDTGWTQSLDRLEEFLPRVMQTTSSGNLL